MSDSRGISPKVWRRLHGAATVIWMALIVPTVLWWKESILWIALMSIWANVVGHFSAWQATRAEQEAKTSS